MARFDWYQATVSTTPAEVIDAVCSLCEGVSDVQPLKKAPHGYGGGFRVADSSGLVGQVWAGGMHELPHVVFTGETAHAGADMLRTEYPRAHRPSRVDACEDFAEPGAYDVLQSLGVEVAKDRRIKIDTRGDHLLTFQGRTLMLGSTKSATMVRIYDKAAELRSKLHADFARLALVPPHLARLEVQVRPHTADARLLAATASPLDFFGSAAWTRQLMKAVTGTDLEPCNMGKSWRQADDDRAYTAMLSQYGGLLGRLGAAQGWGCLGLQLRDDLADRAKAKPKRGGQ